MDNRSIGFFDSGLGGLSCLIHFLKVLPNEGIVYFGDTARTPYGSKSVENIKTFSFEIAEFLVKQKNVKMLVIACNTVSCTAIEYLRAKFPDIPIIGITAPAANGIARSSTAGSRIGVIGTNATIASGMYEKLLSDANPDLEIFSKACSALVPLIEEGIGESPVMQGAIRYYLDSLVMKDKISTLVLGCTHYPLISAQIKAIYPELNIIDPSEIMVGSIVDALEGNGILADISPKAKKFYASDLSDNFVYMVKNIFKMERMQSVLDEVEFEKIDLLDVEV